ncbi:MAG: PAS domain S-box protein [Chlorobiaceae bacterium]|nr:PAS domain S-box protein [Chlorobiaceae bacterium]
MNVDNNYDTSFTFEERYHMLQAVFDTSDIAFVMDRNDIILEANKAFAAMLGKQVQECINTNAFDLLPPDLAASRKEKTDEAFRTGKINTLEDQPEGRFILSTITPIASRKNTITALHISVKDITELRLAEKESQNQQTFSSTLVNAIPGAFYMIDSEGRFVQWNAYERDIVVGKPESVMANTFVIETIHPDDRPIVAEKIRSILEDGIEDSVEVRILMHGGPEVRWFQSTGKRVIINDNKFLIGIGIDITDRKQADIATQEQSEERFRAMFEEHSAVQLIIDHETARIIDANHAAANFYGWSIEELRRKSMYEINTLSVEQAKHEIEKNSQSGQGPLSFKHRRADGSVRDVEILRKIIKIKGKDLSYAIINDVTERKQAEITLKKMSVAVEQSPAIVVMTDAEGNIEYVNPQFTECTGYTIEEAKGQNPRILQSGLMPKSVYEDLWKTILAGNIWRGELQNKKKNGELFWERVVVSAIRNPDGEITNFVAVKEDITEQKILTDALIASKEKAEEHDRLKSAFLANISHEIRTPMNGILGFSELLKEPHLSAEEQAEYIDLMQRSGNRMLNLINDLIDISRIEAGETMLQVTETPVNELLHDVCTFFKPQAKAKGLRLSCTAGLSDNESIIVSDQAKIHQILTNLVQNALKFTHTGGIEIDYTRKGSMLTFCVSDTGIGIPVEIQNRIFDRFLQVDNSLTRTHEGSGLGLSISKAYVGMLGGTIWVESEEGKGSTFIFTIPYNPLKSTTTEYPLPPVEQVTVNPLSGTTILIAEDDEISSYLLKKNLKGENLMILHASNGLEAVAIVQSHPEIDLVLMDLRMPVMSGYESSRQIKQIRPGLPIIAQTAFTSKEDRVKAQEAGCDSFITKPINKTELLGLLQKLLNR